MTWTLNPEQPDFTSAIPAQTQRDVLDAERSSAIDKGYEIERTRERLTKLAEQGFEFNDHIEQLNESHRLLTATVAVIDTQIAALNPLTVVQ